MIQFIIVANLSGLKMIRWVQGAQEIGGDPREELMQFLNISEVEAHFNKQVTDQADRFRNWGSTAEKGRVEIEKEHRAIKKLGALMNSFLKEHLSPDASWNLVAPAEINAKLLEQLDPSCSARLGSNLKKDLMKCSLKEVVAHF